MPEALSLKIGATGVRGVVGESLTPQVVTAYAAAFGTYCGAGPIVVGTDTRPSGEMLKQAAISGLLSVGCAPVDLGIAPSPVLQHFVRASGAFGGVSVTSGHQPPEWNALRFFGPSGIVLRPNQAAELTDLYHQGAYPRVPAEAIAGVRRDETATARHRETVLRHVNVERIRGRRFKLVADCANGAGSSATRELLEALGCDLVMLNAEPGAEPPAKHLGELAEAVRTGGANLGFAQDPDADRVALVDESGEMLDEGCTVALCVRHGLRRWGGPVVVNVATSRMIDDLAAEAGAEVVRTKVGESHVVEAMLARGAAIGGEENGGVIAAAINPCRDSFVAMALVLEALADEGGTLSDMRATMPVYAVARTVLEFQPREVPPAMRRLQRLYEGNVTSLLDGVTAAWPDRWLQARPSSTQPVVRVSAEADTAAAAEALLHEAAECLQPPR
ncbi:MAG: phosphoglucosamine mutase [Armatimonadetes bacterium]|nr:phosphoglucosamine mutase [Armatimonadota bacterium]